jgi:NAD(P)-dependent dehydrogenase (short-subunit alcohol dehydrogenase family)
VKAAAIDVTDPVAVEGLVQDTVTDYGRLDFIFNNAGIVTFGETRDMSLADWNGMIDVNLRGVVHGIAAAYPVMIRQGFGHIVNTASMAGLVANGYLGSYVVAKHAVVGLSKTLRIEAKEYGVQVSVLCPGLIRTPIIEGGRYGRLKDDLDMERWRRSLERLRPLDAPVLAERALRAIARNRAIIVVPGWWRLFWYLDRLSPALAERAFGALYQSGKREIATLRRTSS